MNEHKNFALVTGSSSGIGLAISGELAKRGYNLLMVSNEDEKLREASSGLENKYGIKAIPLCMDLARMDSAAELFDYCQTNNIIVDILVNNAGIFFFKDVIKTPPELAQKIINLHNLTPCNLSRLFAQKMIADNRKGYILMMASASSRMMMPGIALYSGTKGFLRSFARAMRNEVYDKGVSITTLSPGAVATGLYNLPPRYLKLGIFLGIIMTPERLASLAVKKMFKRKAEYIPGTFINTLFIIIVRTLPEFLIRIIKRKIDKKFKNE
ncbi:MAG: SDR family NAD(P)-dependent oxidoreductase [Treponema sp.]|nr:SDR family NAD(P)-dependent oxidoreductase [Treponema sp.]